MGNPETSPRASRAQAISNTIPSRRLAQTRHLSIDSGVSPVQSTSSPSLGQFYYSSSVQRSVSNSVLHNQLRQKTYLHQLALLQTRQSIPTVNSTTPKRQGISSTAQPTGQRSLTFPGAMSSAFDSLYLSGGACNASPYNLTELDGAQYDVPHNSHGTIFPQDVFLDGSMVMSNPPSSAFPNYATPDSSYLESPAMASSAFNTSPMQDGLLDSQLDFAELDTMTPLFPQASLDQFAAQQMPTKPPTKSSFAAVNSNSAQTGMERQKSNGMERQKSSPGRPPSQPYHIRKRSDTCGVSKPSKPRKDLKPLEIESDDDKETAKRKKNTLAARKSRARKMENAEAAGVEIQRLRAIIIRMGGDPDPEED